MLETTKLGRTDLTVSNVCFGTGGLTNGPDADTPERVARAHDTVRAIFDSPVNFIDTSRIYGRGRSEQRIGDVIHERGGLPPGYVLATKLDLDFETRRFDGAAARRSFTATTRTTRKWAPIQSGTTTSTTRKWIHTGMHARWAHTRGA